MEIQQTAQHEWVPMNPNRIEDPNDTGRDWPGTSRKVVSQMTHQFAVLSEPPDLSEFEMFLPDLVPGGVVEDEVIPEPVTKRLRYEADSDVCSVVSGEPATNTGLDVPIDIIRDEEWSSMQEYETRCRAGPTNQDNILFKMEKKEVLTNFIGDELYSGNESIHYEVRNEERTVPKNSFESFTQDFTVGGQQIGFFCPDGCLHFYSCVSLNNMFVPGTKEEEADETPQQIEGEVEDSTYFRGINFVRSPFVAVLTINWRQTYWAAASFYDNLIFYAGSPPEVEGEMDYPSEKYNVQAGVHIELESAGQADIPPVPESSTLKGRPGYKRPKLYFVKKTFASDHRLPSASTHVRRYYLNKKKKGHILAWHHNEVALGKGVTETFPGKGALAGKTGEQKRSYLEEQWKHRDLWASKRRRTKALRAAMKAAKKELSLRASASTAHLNVLNGQVHLVRVGRLGFGLGALLSIAKPIVGAANVLLNGQQRQTRCQNVQLYGKPEYLGQLGLDNPSVVLPNVVYNLEDIGGQTYSAIPVGGITSNNQLAQKRMVMCQPQSTNVVEGKVQYLDCEPVYAKTTIDNPYLGVLAINETNPGERAQYVEFLAGTTQIVGGSPSPLRSYNPQASSWFQPFGTTTGGKECNFRTRSTYPLLSRFKPGGASSSIPAQLAVGKLSGLFKFFWWQAGPPETNQLNSSIKPAETHGLGKRFLTPTYDVPAALAVGSKIEIAPKLYCWATSSPAEKGNYFDLQVFKPGTSETWVTEAETRQLFHYSKDIVIGNLPITSYQETGPTTELINRRVQREGDNWPPWLDTQQGFEDRGVIMTVVEGVVAEVWESQTFQKEFLPKFMTEGERMVREGKMTAGQADAEFETLKTQDGLRAYGFL